MGSWRHDRRLQRGKPLRGLVAEQPAALVVEAARLELELGPSEEHCARREQRPIDVRFAVRIESGDDGIVRIAEGWNVAAAIHDARDELEHRLEAAPVLRAEVASARARDQAGHEHHVGDFMVVPDRLLAVDAVGAVLQQRLLLEFASGGFAPAHACGPQRPCHAIRRTALRARRADDCSPMSSATDVRR